MRTMLPIGLRDVMRVSTTSLSPGALLITLQDQSRVWEIIRTKETGDVTFKEEICIYVCKLLNLLLHRESHESSSLKNQ